MVTTSNAKFNGPKGRAWKSIDQEKLVSFDQISGYGSLFSTTTMGVVHQDFLSQIKSFNKDCYLETESFGEIWYEKRPEWLKTNHGFCIKVMHTPNHRRLAVIYGQRQQHNHASATIITGLTSLRFACFPSWREARKEGHLQLLRRKLHC